MLEDKGYVKKLLSNTLVFGIGNFSSRILIFLLVPIYTRTMNTTEYGYVDLITATITLLLPFFTLNIHEAIIRFTLDKNTDNNSVLLVGLWTIGVGFIPVAIFSPLILSLLGVKQLTIYFILTYLLTALKQVLTFYARGCEKVREVVMVSFIDTALLLTLNLILLLGFNLGINGYYYSLIISSLIVAVIYIKVLNIKVSSLKNKMNKELLKNMYSYSLPMIPNSVSWWISNTSDKYMLTYFWDVSTTGIYAVAFKIPSLLNTVTKIFMEAWQISAVEEYESKNSNNFSEVFKYFFGVNMIVCIILILLSDYIALIMFSKNFIGATKFVPTLLCAYFFNGLASYLGTIYTSSKRTKMLFISTMVGAILNLGFNYILIPLYGGQGAAIGTLISYFFVWLVRLIDTKQIIKLKIDPIDIGIQIIALLCITFFINKEMSLISIIVIIISVFIIIIKNLFVIISIKNMGLQILKHKKNK